MDRMIYLSMSGAKATMQRQETLANNLANVSTVGFRAELAAFRAVPVQGSGASTRVYALESTPGYDATPGQIAATGRNLDVAMKGGAWLAVQGLDGTEAYTRGGSLQTDAEGNLVTTAGLTVLGDAGPVQVPRDTVVSFAPDGTISASRDQRPQQHHRPAQAGHAGRAARARHRRPVPRRRRRARRRSGRAPGGRRARKLERQRGRDDGGDDRRGAPVRGADEDALHRREQREGGGSASVAELSPAPRGGPARRRRARPGSRRSTRFRRSCRAAARRRRG